MSTSPRASLETGETRSDTPTSTIGSLTALASETNEQSSTPPTSVADSADTASQIEKQESPIHTIAEQPLNEVEMEASATNLMPPPASTGGRSMRRRTLQEGAYDINALIRRDSGHQKRGPRRSNEAVKNERDAAVARRQTMSDIPAFDGNNNDYINSESTAEASASRRPHTPDNNDSGVSDVEMVAQSSSEGRSDADAKSSTTKRACRSTKGEEKAHTEVERLKRLEAKYAKQLEKANEKVVKLQQKLEMIKKGDTPSKSAAPTPSPVKLKREVKRLEDTKEYKKDESNVVIIEEVWSKGKKVVPGQPEPAKKSKKAEAEKAEVAVIEEKPKEVKKKGLTYKKAGLYAGSEYVDPFWTPKERKEQNARGFKARKVLPLTMGLVGKELLSKNRDFQLPWAVCNPIVGRGHEKPPKWNIATKNRFVGDAKAQWKSWARKDDAPSKCQCGPADGCGDHCINRGMSYECTVDNCKIGAEHCTNRAFADLAARTVKGGDYCIGVDVVKTGETGFGVRANRGFKAGQIIVEYCGEIITEDECDRRMEEDYKDNKCYYLMLFDQKMIIDAQVRGSVARFVNHSCAPNCQMVKLVVNGEPRMALFAEREITTGEELTYDYNFNPFSSDNKQKCYCGADNCRGYLMPKTNNEKKKEAQSLAGGVAQAVRGAAQVVTKTAKGAASSMKTTGKDLKRKANEFISPVDDKGESSVAVKKRKTAKPKSPAKTALPAKALNLGKKVYRRMTLPASSKSTTDAVASATPKLKTRAFLGVPKTYGSTGEKKQMKLTFFSSSSVSSFTAKKHKAGLVLAALNDEDSDSNFFVPESETESEDEVMEDVVEAVNVVNTIIRKPLPSAAPAAALGKGGNRLRLVINPSPTSSAPASGQSSRDVSPGPPIVSSHDDFVASKRPRFRAVLNKTKFPAPPAPTPGGPPVPKRPRKRASQEA